MRQGEPSEGVAEQRHGFVVAAQLGQRMPQRRAREQRVAVARAERCRLLPRGRAQELLRGRELVLHVTVGPA